MPHGLKDKLHNVTVGPIHPDFVVKRVADAPAALEAIEAETFDRTYVQWVVSGQRRKAVTQYIDQLGDQARGS